MYELKGSDFHPGINVQNDLIDRFPVKKMTPGKVVFDYSKGLPTRFLKSWLAPDKLTKLNIEYSYTYDFQNRDNLITFGQLMRLDDEKGSTMILRHYFGVYKQNPNFTPVKMVNPLRIGIFPGSFRDGQAQALRKFDISKPIKWYISSNTPLKYRQAIKEGILWWNNAFKKNVMQVEFLDAPVAWASARMNVFQWSEKDSFCGGAMAFGPSLADPLTGEVLSAKVIFCGPSAEGIFKSFNDGSYKWDEVGHKMLRWASAHEVGHTLGFAHNFYAKLYQEKGNMDVMTSSVMDYPNPIDTLKIADVGVRDYAAVKFLYLENGSQESFNQLATIPFCGDRERSYNPHCNAFTKRRMNAYQLMDDLLNKVENDPRSIIGGDLTAIGAIIKLIFDVEDERIIKNLKTIARGLNRYDNIWSSVYSYTRTTKPLFLYLSESYHRFVFAELLEAFNEVGTISAQGSIVQIINEYKIYPAFQTLNEMLEIVKETIRTSRNSDELTKAYKLQNFIQKKVDKFWDAQ